MRSNLTIIAIALVATLLAGPSFAADQMLTSEEQALQKPFRADTAMGILYLHAQAPVPLLPPHLAVHQALINMMLAKKPEDRLQSADEVAEWV